MLKIKTNFLLIFFMTLCAINDSKAFEISKVDTLAIAQRVFKNECNIEKNCLLEWNVGENFLSLGLGHFIWYPENSPNIYQEGFRAYLQYARQAGERLPVWLDKTPFPACPWATREQFLNSKNSQQYKDLIDFMTRTKDCQAAYIIDNTQRSLQKIIDAVGKNQRPQITQLIAQLSSGPQGLFAIIDYLDFKGAGIGHSENFKGEGWGLLQVLEGMRESLSPQDILPEFVRSAKMVLTHRVFLAPNDRNEDQWLQGWLRRMDTYLVPQT